MLPSLAELEALDLAYARFNAVRSLRLADPELCVERVGELDLLRDPSRPDDETYNRVLGLRDGRVGALDEALARFGTEPQVDVPVDACTPALLAALSARGLAPARAVVWLAGDPAGLARELPARVGVRRLHEEDAGRFLDLLGSGGEPIGDDVRAKRQRYYCTERFGAFVATLDGAPAGWATLFVDDDRGVLGNAFTLPAHRRRGVQRALFAARAAHAAELGLRWVATDIEPDGPSHRNAVRAGLSRRTTMLWFRRASATGAQS